MRARCFADSFLLFLVLTARCLAVPPVPDVLGGTQTTQTVSVAVETTTAATIDSATSAPTLTGSTAPPAVPIPPVVVPPAPEPPVALPAPAVHPRIVRPSPNMLPAIINDPIEPFNRAMFSFNNGVAVWVLRPVEKGYRWLLPRPVRKRIGMVGNNLAYPVRLFGTLLQAKWRGAFDETSRFVINTTVGVVGIFDPAASMGIPPWKEDFGQAFGWWGNGPGFYLVIPFLGPSSGRDGLGAIFDTAANPASYVPGLPLFLRVNDNCDQIDAYIRTLRSEQDPYVLIKDLCAIDRQREVIDYAIRTGQTEPEATLQVVFLSVQDPAFPGKARQGSARIPATGRKLAYTYWLQPKPAPVIFILPGLGGNRRSMTSAALAEMAWRQGLSAVTLSSPFNWDFMLNASSAAVPGYTPVDAEDILNAIRAIRADLDRRHRGMATHNAVMGLSIGAMETLFLAAIDHDRFFSRYVAINPPLDAQYALEMLDSYYQAPLDWPDDQRARKMNETLYKAMLLSHGSLTPDTELPFSATESHYIIGLYYHLTLRDIIYASQKRQNLGVIDRDFNATARDPLYAEINNYLWVDYLDQFVLPYDQRQMPGMTARQLIDTAGVWSIGPRLRENPDVRVFTNSTDFLLGPHDIERLRELIGDRLTVFPGGGHVGNLYKPDVQEKIMQSIAELNQR